MLCLKIKKKKKRDFHWVLSGLGHEICDENVLFVIFQCRPHGKWKEFLADK